MSAYRVPGSQKNQTIPLTFKRLSFKRFVFTLPSIYHVVEIVPTTPPRLFQTQIYDKYGHAYCPNVFIENMIILR